MARKAVAEASMLIANHGIAIATLWRQAGLPIDETDQPSLSN